MSRMGSSKAGRRARRQFTDEFKAGAVRLVLDEGRTVGAVARELDLTETAFRKWVEQARADRTDGKAGVTTAEREELARLRKENRQLRMDREILVKAAAYSIGRRNAMTDEPRRDHGARATIAGVDK
jgi:transposase